MRFAQYAAPLITLLRKELPPGGKPRSAAFKYSAPLFENFLKGKFSNKKEKQAFLHHRLSVGDSPQGEALK